MRVALIAAALVALAGCGFKPMYAPTAAGAAPLIGPVTVPEVRGKAGHAFRTELTRLLEAESGDGAPKQLEIAVTETVTPLGLRVDESSTRADFIMTATYKLLDPNGAELVRGTSAATVSYDIPVAAYGAAAAQDDARERAGVLLADRVRTDLALRLSRLRNAAPATP
ncbi:MAG: LPS assembly lipoprotein LptE [Hyphomonadaceae bacterium]